MFDCVALCCTALLCRFVFVLFSNFVLQSFVLLNNAFGIVLFFVNVCFIFCLCVCVCVCVFCCVYIGLHNEEQESTELLSTNTTVNYAWENSTE